MTLTDLSQLTCERCKFSCTFACHYFANLHCNTCMHCNCIRCRFFDQGMRNLHALQHLQLRKICKSAYNCVQFACNCKFGLRMCMLAFACQYFANLHCNCIRCRFSNQGMRNLHALQHLQDYLQIGLQLCANIN